MEKNPVLMVLLSISMIKKINEVYYLFKGTEPQDFNDVWADAAGIGAGSSFDQLNDAKKMYKNVQKDIKNRTINGNIEIKKYGDGYSLGGGNVVGLALYTKGFDNIRGLNDAPINVYQMYKFDRNFAGFIFKHTGLNDIETISEKNLIKYAKEYYGSEIPKISHTRVKGEPLHNKTLWASYTLDTKSLFWATQTHLIFPMQEPTP